MKTKEYFDRVKEAEPYITAKLFRIGRSFGVTMTGLENRFKTIDSLKQKLDSRDISEVNDMLRYTYILPNKEYSDLVGSVAEDIQRAGFTVNQVKNFWAEDHNPKDNGLPVYGGIHLQLSDKNGQKFEVQMHTAKSYKVKELTHEMYKMTRNPECSEESKAYLYKQMNELFQHVRIPKGAAQIEIGLDHGDFAMDVARMLSESEKSLLRTSRDKDHLDIAI